jgi:hypothetical protein
MLQSKKKRKEKRNATNTQADPGVSGVIAVDGCCKIASSFVGVGIN